MPCHTIVHRQDWFLEERYRARTGKEEPGFLDRSFELHFNERPFLNHFPYLFITRTTKERMRQQKRNRLKAKRNRPVHRCPRLCLQR